MEVSVREFKAHFSSYLARVRLGEELVVTSHKHPVARVLGLAASPDRHIEALLKSGLAEWHGGKPAGGKRKPVISGKSLAEMVLEDRD